MIQFGIERILEKNPVIPVATISDEVDMHQKIEKITTAGIKCIEITLRTDFALTAIEQIKAMQLPDFSVGVGTVTNAAQLRAVKKLAVDFIVSPGLTSQLHEDFIETEIPFIPGVSTVSEIMRGMELGLTYFKFFPANLFGGLAALQAYGQLFPHLRFCPTGGISEATYNDYLKEKNIISVGGSWMLK